MRFVFYSAGLRCAEADIADERSFFRLKRLNRHFSRSGGALDDVQRQDGGKQRQNGGDKLEAHFCVFALVVAVLLAPPSVASRRVDRR